MFAMLQARLSNIMQNEVDAQGLRLSFYCTQQIEQVLFRGLARMRSAKALDHPGHVLQAERNLKALIKYLGTYARNIGSHPRLTNTDFDKAMNACPNYWPYTSSG